MNNILEPILYMVLAVLFCLIITLIIVYISVKKKENEALTEDDEIFSEDSDTTKTPSSTKTVRQYETKSIFDFMEFETIKDNMIIQKGGKRFLMAVECKGVNYDLMSEVEKASTEQGFGMFLNSLKEQIQIYIQTRTINLEKNISTYTERMKKVKDEIEIKEYKVKEMEERGTEDEKLLRRRKFDLLRMQNMYGYGQDIISDTKRMSLNKNVLKKKYYIILKYFYEPTDDLPDMKMSEEEIKEIAFSNLYTKATAFVRVLSGIGVVGRVLNSYELVELLYNAYNRDDSEVFGIDKAVEAGYNEIYVDSQNVIDKKIEALNKEIELKAQEQARNVVEEVYNERNQELKDIENNIDNIIEDLAIKIIKDDNNHIPEEIKEKAIKKVTNRNTKKGEKQANEKQETKERIRKNKAS